MRFQVSNMSLFVMLVGALLVSATNVTVDSNATKNRFFNVGTECVNDNYSGNAYCFVKRDVQETLTCASFGVAAKYNYSSPELGVLIRLNESLCNPLVRTETTTQNVSVRINEYKKLDFDECYINADANITVCAPKLELPTQVMILKKGDSINDTKRGILAIIDNESFEPVKPTPTPPPIIQCGDGKCEGQENSTSCARDCPLNPPSENQRQNNNPFPTAWPREYYPQPQQGENYFALAIIVIAVVGGLWWYANRKTTQEGSV